MLRSIWINTRSPKLTFSLWEAVVKAFFETLFDYIFMHVPEAMPLSLWESPMRCLHWERDTFGNKFKV